MPEVGKRHDALAANSKHLFQQLVRCAHGLEGFCHQHHVEARVREPRQTIVEVVLYDVHARPDAGVDPARVDVHAIASHVLVRLQVREQFAIATSKVKHARAGFDQIGDDPEILPHCPHSDATRSR